jgi:hypothetical protein
VIKRPDDIQRRYLELQTERVEQRVARTLLRIMKRSGRKTNEGILIDFRLSRQDLADYTATTPYTVSRTVRNWGKRVGSGWAVNALLQLIPTHWYSLWKPGESPHVFRNKNIYFYFLLGCKPSALI